MKFHDSIQMYPTSCQMQIIKRHFPMANKNDCAIRYEGGSHFDNGRDFDGGFVFISTKKVDTSGKGENLKSNKH